MKFKILPGSELFDQLQEIYRRGLEAKVITVRFLEEMFPHNQKYVARDGCFGGIDCIHFDKKPDGWKQVGESWQRLYAPKASEKALIRAFSALPVVKKDEIKAAIGYGNYAGMSNGNLVWSSNVGFVFSDDFILIETSSVANEYVPKPEMIEILESEFLHLKEIELAKIEELV